MTVDTFALSWLLTTTLMVSLTTTTNTHHNDLDFFTLYRVDDAHDDCLHWLEHLPSLSQYPSITHEEKYNIPNRSI